MRQWQHYKNPSARMVFEDLLLSANWHEGTVDGITVTPGDVVTSVPILMQNTGLSKPTVIKQLNLLEETGEITRTKLAKATVIHINNFKIYQSNEEDEEGVKQVYLRGKTNLPLTDPRGKIDLPQNPSRGKIDLPQGVKQIYPMGKMILPIQEYNKNILEEERENAHTHAHACEEDLATQMINEQPWFEQLCMSRRIDPQTMINLIHDFCSYLRDIDKKESLMEAKMHFVNQLPKQLQILKNGQTYNTNDPVTKRQYERNQRLQSVAARAAALASEHHGTNDEVP